MKSRKLNKTVICAVLTLHLFGFTYISHTQEKTTQETHGNQSPAVLTESGNVTITYGMAIETKEALEEFINSKDREIADLKQRLIDIYKNEFDSLPEEAEKWAKHFLTTMPIRKDCLKFEEQSLDQARKDKRLELEKLPKRIEVIFKFLFDSIDSKITALQKIDEVLKYEKTENSDPIFSESPSTETVRKIIFKNGSLISIDLNQGGLEKGLIRTGPKLYFKSQYSNSSKSLFCVKAPRRGGSITGVGGSLVQDVKEPKIADVTYNVQGESLISKQFKDVFLKSFDEALGRVYYKDSQLSLKTE